MPHLKDEVDSELMTVIGDRVYRTSHYHTSTKHFAYVYSGGEIVGTIDIDHIDESVTIETPDGIIDVDGYSDLMAMRDDAWRPIIERLDSELGNG